MTFITTLHKTSRKIGLGFLGALFIIGAFFVSTGTAFAVLNATTDAATGISTTDATLNGTNGDTDATGHSFWASLSTFDTSSPSMPVGVYSTADLGSISAGTPFSALLSSTGITVTPATTYYFAAWSSVDGTWYPGAVLSFETAPVAPTTGSIEITKYVCPADTVVTRSTNGVDGTVPEGCTLDESGKNFGYVHGEQTDANAPYPEVDAPITEGGITNGSGVLSINDLPATGRYLVVESDGSGTKLAHDAILGLYCVGDADTSGTNDNQELTFVPAGQSVECIAYNKTIVIPTEDNFCSVEVVSDTTNTVNENADANAVATYNSNPAWTAMIPGATWIWETFYVVDPLSETTKTFKKTFTIADLNTAVLSIAADNSYEVLINGNNVVIPMQADENNFSLETQDNNIDIAVTGFLNENALNTIEVRVKNWVMVDSTSETNPAGALYKLIINGETLDNVCQQLPSDPDFAKVHIYKYIGATQVPDDATFPSFPMHASWVTTNFPSGEGDYVLGNTHGGAAFRYAADTSDMATPVASYNTYEITDGSVVLPIGAECAPDKFRLVGYKSGDSLMAAQGATLSATAPTYTDFSEDKYLIVVNENCNDAVDNFCSLEVVSDTTNTVNENANANAVATYNSNPAWTASIPGATWIWETFYVVDPLVETTKTFKKTFTIEDVNTAVLSIAADNSYEVFINSVNVPILTQTDEDNYRLETQDNSIDVASYLTENALNTIEVRVKNWIMVDSTSETNPAGTLYKLIVNGEEVDNICKQPPTDETGSITIDKVVAGEGASADEKFTFDHSWNDGSFDLSANDAPHVISNLSAGSYTITELINGTDDWSVSDVTCTTANYSHDAGEGDVQITLGANEDVTCTYTNTYRLGSGGACTVGNNLLSNGSFEDPIVDGEWGIFATVANWVISSDGLELWRNFMGGAADGSQNVELDGNVPTTVTQAVTTVPGATYELSFEFSPRPETALANNNVDALVDGVVLMNASGDGSALATTTWTEYSQTFVAGDASTDVAFTDNGVSDALGSLIDNAVLCYVSGPTSGGDTSEMVLVTPPDLNITVTPGVKDWYFYDDVTNTPSTLEVAGDYEFVTGPGNPTLGDGSVQMSVTGTERWNIATNQFAGTDLDMVSVFTFETYQPSTNPGSDQRAIYLNFDVDFDNAVVEAYAGRLAFVPADNATVVEDVWQSHDADSGMWRWSRYESNGNMWPDNDPDALRSWSEIMTAFPNAEMLVGGQLLFRAGDPYVDGFTGAVDNLVIKVGTHTTTYNFEPVAPQPTNDGGNNNNRSSGGSSRRIRGSSSSNSSNDGEVLGATTGGGQVLAQTTFLPIGAPNTGFGGSKMCLY